MGRKKKDRRSAKVEEWKKSDQTKRFLKNLKGLNQVRKVLEMKGMALSEEMSSTRDLYRQLMLSYEGLLSAQPKEKLGELPGMNFEGEELPENWRIRY